MSHWLMQLPKGGPINWINERVAGVGRFARPQLRQRRKDFFEKEHSESTQLMWEGAPIRSS